MIQKNIRAFTLQEGDVRTYILQYIDNPQPWYNSFIKMDEKWHRYNLHIKWINGGNTYSTEDSWL